MVNRNRTYEVDDRNRNREIMRIRDNGRSRLTVSCQVSRVTGEQVGYGHDWRTPIKGPGPW